MWGSEWLWAPYAMVDVELTEAPRPIALSPKQGGAHVILRHRDRPVGRLWLSRSEHGGRIAAEALRRMALAEAAQPIARLLLEEELLGGARPPAPVPSLTIAVCTRNRAPLLRRCLAALVALRDGAAGAAIDIVVVDNAPDDASTRDATAEFPSVRYAIEPVPGLDFGRNRAIAETDRDWLAFVDDDAVIDRGWLRSLSEGIQASPGAAAFTGPILPLMLDTEAQLRFEMAGGFGKGFAWDRFGPERWGDPIYPTGAGRFGTGACMAFRTATLRALGGFDEALDTGPPLPGGGDVDMFYRVLRAGNTLVYLPGLVVHHEHRRDMVGLRKQYYSWGLGLMALISKNDATDPAMRIRQIRLLMWWYNDALRRLAKALIGRGVQPPGLVWAELRGSVVGYFGEYRRSQARIAERKRAHGS